IILNIIIILIVFIALVHIIHILTLDRIIEYKEISFYSTNIPPGMNGYKIAFITDTHNISDNRLQSIVAELNKRSIDLTLLGGDFSMQMAEMQKHIEILSNINSADGIYGVDGNHDYPYALSAAMEEHGMTFLSNQGLYIRENFFLAGVEFWSKSNPNSDMIADTINGSVIEDFVLLLSHSPYIAMAQDTAGIDLILSGHTHGGQVNFFGIWAPYFTFTKGVTEYGHRFKSGWAKSRDNVPVFVSNGTGEYAPRIFARPQVILISLYNE
ncbi:MAG: metallophosphoesterase family protein, partial [Oscillospiraceae bacterium]|nr:metallophosphoesterase family protein [Oscillospiraceae bacterium]